MSTYEVGRGVAGIFEAPKILWSKVWLNIDILQNQRYIISQNNA
jgi:hypothetical protein